MGGEVRGSGVLRQVRWCEQRLVRGKRSVGVRCLLSLSVSPLVASTRGLRQQPILVLALAPSSILRGSVRSPFTYFPWVLTAAL